MRILSFLFFTLITVISLWGNENAEVNVSSLNVRLEPNKNSQKIAQLENGTQVEIIREDNSGWAYIETSNTRWRN